MQQHDKYFKLLFYICHVNCLPSGSFNKQSVTINFPSDKLEAVNKYVIETLKFHKSSRKTGAIYKNNDRSVTVTVYDTTSTIHVQGAGQMLWSEQFGKTDFVRETCDKCDTSTTLSGDNAGETVPKSLEESVYDDGTIPKSLEDSVGETVPKSLEESLSFREALDSLHPTVTSTPRRDSESLSELPLQEAIAVLTNQVRILQDKLVRHEQSKSLIDASTQTEPEIPEPCEAAVVTPTPINNSVPQMEQQVTTTIQSETPEPPTADNSINNQLQSKPMICPKMFLYRIYRTMCRLYKARPKPLRKPKRNLKSETKAWKEPHLS